MSDAKLQTESQEDITVLEEGTEIEEVDLPVPELERQSASSTKPEIECIKGIVVQTYGSKTSALYVPATVPSCSNDK